MDSAQFSQPDKPPTYGDEINIPSREVLLADAAEQNRYRPLTLTNGAAVVVFVSLVTIAVAVEVTLAISTKNGGIPPPAHNIFTTVSPRFLAAFIPTLVVAGLVLVWQSSDRSYRELQPYIVLARGDVTAAEGLLANYSGLGVYGIVSNALKFRHYLILLSTLTTLLGNFLQPLAGSIIQVVQLPQTTNGIFVQNTKTIGLASDRGTLNGFLAAAGFSDASVFHGLPDPSFIHAGWAIADFKSPPAVLNGTLSANTTAIQTAPNCEIGQSVTLYAPGSVNVTIVASNSAGCNGSVTFDSSSASLQYGVIPIGNCGSDVIEFQPVMFWFFHHQNDTDQTPQGASVFCQPTIQALNVMATFDLNNNSVIEVTTLSSLTSSNNVTGSPGNGQAFNAVRFTPSNDTFVQARATAIGAGVSGAIFRSASQLSGGLQPTFDNGFLSLTEQVYTQHLSISAKSVYFIDGVSTSPANIVSLAPRLWIDPIPAHILTAVLALIACSALFIHIVHSRQRRRFFLAASPGSIAHIISMTAYSRFGAQAKLFPYDNDATLARKLAGLSFGLDPRTGAIVADRNVHKLSEPAGAPAREVEPYRLTLADTDMRGSGRYRASTGASTSFGGGSSSRSSTDATTTLLLPMPPFPMKDEKRGSPRRPSNSELEPTLPLYMDERPLMEDTGST